MDWRARPTNELPLCLAKPGGFHNANAEIGLVKTKLKTKFALKESIMKRILWLIVATFAICLTTLTTYAQSSLKLRFSVPFAFTSGNTVFPAGEYEVTQADRYVLRLRNVETQTSGFEHVQPKSLRSGGGSTEVVFYRYGTEYFLARVTDGPANSAYDLRQSKQKSWLANGGSNPQPDVVSFLANGVRSQQ
jgi:hypothetical protein